MHYDSVERSYDNAVQILESRRRQSRPRQSASQTESRSAIPVASGTPDLRGTPSIVGMKEWLHDLGHSLDDVDSLNVIHIAGTKGKGSTCAFVESLLRAYGERNGTPYKTGLYTSPHLIHPEERIRINSLPLDRALFAKYFFEIYDRLPQLAEGQQNPRFLQLFALFAMHVFVREGVDVAILETHNGGEYDATNVVQKPFVTAITSLGMDHVAMLGPTIENIAWHKSGIFKSGSVALSTIQDPAPAQVLQDRAVEKGSNVTFVEEDSRLPPEMPSLKTKAQKKNTSLAIATVEAFLQRNGPRNFHSLALEDIKQGIEQWSWPGRFQIIHENDRTWFLDAAHNEMSVAVAAQWFAECSVELSNCTGKDSTLRILIFSHINELRDASDLLANLATALKKRGMRIDHVIFSTYENTEKTNMADENIKNDVFRGIWKKSMSESEIWDEPTVPGAITRARKIADEAKNKAAHILITGSQHLVGPSLRVLQSG